jgi:hypothetical protein
VSKPKLFDKLECKNCVFKVEATAGTSAHTTFGEKLLFEKLRVG